jgi:RHS repeat-associated protein
MNIGVITIIYLLGDHSLACARDRLGSQAITTSSSGTLSAEIRYYPWGKDRYTSGTTPTNYKFTGQRYENALGLYFYNSRWYDPMMGRFIQADTIVPGGIQGLDRYAYTANNPLKYIDPSGHDYCESNYADPVECAEIDPDGNGLTEPPVDLADNLDFCNAGACYDGAMMQKLYWKYAGKSGWWNDDGKRFFTVKDFLVLILFYEMGGQADNSPKAAEAYTQAINKKMIYLCSEYSTSGSCDYMNDYAMLNYIATRGSAWLRYDNYISDDNPIPRDKDSPKWRKQDYSVAENITNASLVLDPNWNQGELWDFGNGSTLPSSNQIAYKYAEIGYEDYQVFWKSNDSIAFVMTANQLEYWYSP